MTQSQPPLPQPQLQPAGITFDQYVEFTLEKLELREGYIRANCAAACCTNSLGA